MPGPSFNDIPLGTDEEMAAVAAAQRKDTPVPVSVPKAATMKLTPEEIAQLREMGVDVSAINAAHSGVMDPQQRHVRAAKFQNVQRVGKNKVLSLSTLGTNGVDPFMTMDFVEARTTSIKIGSQAADYGPTQLTGVVREDTANGNTPVVGFVPPNMRGVPMQKGNKKHHKGNKRR